MMLSKTRGLLLGALPCLLLAGCASTLTESHALATADADSWAAAQAQLPYEVYGAVPGRSATQLAALFPRQVTRQYASLDATAAGQPAKRIVMYVNAASLPPAAGLCVPGAGYTPAAQTGARADVTAALCDGTTVVSTATGKITSEGASEADIKRGLSMVADELIYVLFPVTHDYYG